MLHVFGDERSGSSLKVKWALDYLQRPYRWHRIETSTSLECALGSSENEATVQNPLLLFDDGRSLSNANAIALYLCEGTELVPADPLDRARALQWLFWEQGHHEPFLSGFWAESLSCSSAEANPEIMELGGGALARMELQLLQTPFLIGSNLSVADLCLLPNTVLAAKRGFDLAGFTNVMAWLHATATMLEIETPEVHPSRTFP